MKAENSSEINKGYLFFALYLALCVMVGVGVYSFYLRTSVIEVKRISAKMEEYDAIYVQQMKITEDIDSLYRYSSMLFNTNLNGVRLQNAVSRRKHELLTSISSMNVRDVRIHQKLMGELNNFLSIKDSISILKQQEADIKNELRKCIDENKQASRKIITTQ